MKIAEEKRKMQDEIQMKKKEMMETFEKLLKKGELGKKEEFYNKIFSDSNRSKILSNKHIINPRIFFI
jgi:hypothetical protein